MSQSIFHYTDVDGLVGILESNSLFATHYAYLNDLSEGTIIRNLLLPIFEAELLELLTRLVQEGLLSDEIFHEHGHSLHRTEAENIFNVILRSINHSTPFFVTSFCRHPAGSKEFEDGLLSQWRGYAGTAGFAVEFDQAELEHISELEEKEPGYAFIKTDYVLYNNHEKLLDTSLFRGVATEAIKKVFASQKIDVSMASQTGQLNKSLYAFASTAPFLKNPSFAEEQEYRIVAAIHRRHRRRDRTGERALGFRRRNSLLTPYISLFSKLKRNLPIKSIIVGPHSYQEKQAEAIGLACDQCGYDAKIKLSAVPYRL